MWPGAGARSCVLPPLVELTGLSAGGLSYAERTLSTDEDTVFAPGSYAVERELDIRQTFSHPGGARAHGDTMVVAMDGVPDHTGSSSAAEGTPRLFWSRSSPVVKGTEKRVWILETQQKGYLCA